MINDVEDVDTEGSKPKSYMIKKGDNADDDKKQGGFFSKNKNNKSTASSGKTSGGGKEYVKPSDPVPMSDEEIDRQYQKNINQGLMNNQNKNRV